MEGSIGKKRHHPLTLESLQDGFVRDMITRPGSVREGGARQPKADRDRPVSHDRG